MCGQAEKSKWTHTHKGHRHTHAGPSLVLHGASFIPQRLHVFVALWATLNQIWWLAVCEYKKKWLGCSLEAYWLIHHLVNMHLIFPQWSQIALRLHSALQWLSSVTVSFQSMYACDNKCDFSGCLLLFRDYGMSANKISDLFLPASHWLSQEARATFICFTCHWLTPKPQIVTLSL